VATSEGFEPPTLAFEARCSIQLSYEASIGRQISKIIAEGREIWEQEDCEASEYRAVSTENPDRP
jgi:hypothetical protein